MDNQIQNTNNLETNENQITDDGLDTFDGTALFKNQPSNVIFSNKKDNREDRWNSTIVSRNGALATSKNEKDLTQLHSGYQENVEFMESKSSIFSKNVENQENSVQIATNTCRKQRVSYFSNSELVKIQTQQNNQKTFGSPSQIRNRNSLFDGNSIYRTSKENTINSLEKDFEMTHNTKRVFHQGIATGKNINSFVVSPVKLNNYFSDVTDLRTKQDQPNFNKIVRNLQEKLQEESIQNQGEFTEEDIETPVTSRSQFQEDQKILPDELYTTNISKNDEEFKVQIIQVQLDDQSNGLAEVEVNQKKEITISQEVDEKDDNYHKFEEVEVSEEKQKSKKIYKFIAVAAVLIFIILYPFFQMGLI